MRSTHFFAFLYFSQIYRGVFVGLYERLQAECQKNKTTVTTLLKEFGISTGRIGSWKSGRKPNPAEIKLFADRLNVSTEYLLTGQEYNPDNKIILTTEETKIINEYRYLSDKSKTEIRNTLNHLYNMETQIETSKELTPPTDKLKKYVTKVSAGSGEFLFPEQDDYKIITVFETDETRRADFALEVHGDSMLPTYQDEDIVLVRKQPSVYKGEIGIFVADGNEGFIKKYGDNKLISLNPECDDIPFDRYETIECKGLVVGKISKSGIIDEKDFE